MSAHQIHTHQYGCKCGKAFSGERKRIELLLRLHYKKCKCPRSEESSIGEINVYNSARDGSQKIIAGSILVNSNGFSEMKSFFGSM